jgi:hypothetical protein
MDLRWLVVAAFLVLPGCAGPAPGHAPAETGPVDDAPAPTAATDEGRQSRPGASAEGGGSERDPFEPFSWRGETDGGACVDVTVGCAGVSMSGGGSRRVPVGAGVHTVRLTVTWNAVDSRTEELVLSAGTLGTVQGPSPLTLEVRASQDFDARVEPTRDGPLFVAQQQPFDGLAEFS